MKTLRNCLASFSRNLRNDGKYLSWQHIVRIHNKDLDDGLKELPKLTQDHINLSSYSKMTVRFAVQVLSETVANVLKKSNDPEVLGTAQFCEMADKFFDCVNVRSLDEAKHKRKPFLAPYSSLEDSRFDWLKKTFLPYFTNWLKSIQSRQGEFTKQDLANMFISRQTHEGLVMTSWSLIECVKFLLSEGMEYVLTERLCQDPVEEYFGAQRKIGRRAENPDFEQCLYNDNTIRIQREISINSGNTRGRYNKKRSWEQVTDEKVPKRKSVKVNIKEKLEKIDCNL